MLECEVKLSADVRNLNKIEKSPRSVRTHINH